MGRWLILRPQLRLMVLGVVPMLAPATPQSVPPSASSQPDRVTSGTFHLYQEWPGGGADTASLGYGLDGKYILRPHEVVVTIERGPVAAHREVILHSLRVGVCGSPKSYFSPDIKLGDVRLTTGGHYSIPHQTVAIPLLSDPPDPNWLCSVLSESTGDDVAAGIRHPILIPLAVTNPTAQGAATSVQSRSGAGAEHRKSPSANTRIKLEFGDFALWVNETKWKQQPADAVAGVLQFRSVDGEGFARVVAEKISVPTEALAELALTNAKQSDPNAKVTLRGKRTVNGREVLVLQIDLTVKNIPLRLYSYSHGGTSGTIQVVTYTAASAFDSKADEFTEFLDGLEISDQDLPKPDKAAAASISDPGRLLLDTEDASIEYNPQTWRKTESKDASGSAAGCASRDRTKKCSKH
jgi:hypothetical protein